MISMVRQNGHFWPPWGSGAGYRWVIEFHGFLAFRQWGTFGRLGAQGADMEFHEIRGGGKKTPPKLDPPPKPPLDPP